MQNSCLLPSAIHQPLSCMRRSNGSRWASLPLHLMDNVLQNLQQDVLSILQTRLVCKAWRTACASFSGPAIINLSRGYDTFGVSDTLPGLHELRMSITANRMYLPPLLSLSRLTCLRMTYTESETLPHPGRDPLFDLIILPPGLRALELHNCYVDPQSFTYIRCTALTRLEFHRTDNQVEEIEDLLQHLPLLQVNHSSKSSSLNSCLTAARPSPQVLPASNLTQTNLLPGPKFGATQQN